MVAATQFRVADDDAMALDDCSRADADMLPDDGVGADRPRRPRFPPSNDPLSDGSRILGIPAVPLTQRESADGVRFPRPTPNTRRLALAVRAPSRLIPAPGSHWGILGARLKNRSGPAGCSWRGRTCNRRCGPRRGRRKGTDRRACPGFCGGRIHPGTATAAERRPSSSRTMVFSGVAPFPQPSLIEGVPALSQGHTSALPRSRRETVSRLIFERRRPGTARKCRPVVQDVRDVGPSDDGAAARTTSASVTTIGRVNLRYDGAGRRASARPRRGTEP